MPFPPPSSHSPSQVQATVSSERRCCLLQEASQAPGRALLQPSHPAWGNQQSRRAQTHAQPRGATAQRTSGWRLYCSQHALPRAWATGQMDGVPSSRAQTPPVLGISYSVLSNCLLISSSFLLISPVRKPRFEKRNRWPQAPGPSLVICQAEAQHQLCLQGTLRLGPVPSSTVTGHKLPCDRQLRETN